MKKNLGTKRLHELLDRDEILVAPSCYDPLSASLIEQAGFDAVFVSGASLTNAYMGISDIGVFSYGEYRDVIRNILLAVSIPVMVDVDTGYGGILPIKRMVEEYEAMGVAGIQMEDQTFPKRCAYFGTTVVSIEDMCRRIRAAIAARNDPNFLIIARTDCSSSLGFDEALRRAKAYIDAGADMIFTSAIPTREDVERLAKLDIPMSVSVVEGTVTEGYTPAMLQKMGFKLVKYPQTLIRATIKAQWDVLNMLKKTGDARDYADMLCTQKERAELTKLSEYVSFEKTIG